MSRPSLFYTLHVSLTAFLCGSLIFSLSCLFRGPYCTAILRFFFPLAHVRAPKTSRRLWPAIWLLPEQNAYGQWPASGEIDIMVRMYYCMHAPHAEIKTPLIYVHVLFCFSHSKILLAVLPLIHTGCAFFFVPSVSSFDGFQGVSAVDAYINLS